MSGAARPTLFALLVLLLGAAPPPAVVTPHPCGQRPGDCVAWPTATETPDWAVPSPEVCLDGFDAVMMLYNAPKGSVVISRIINAPLIPGQATEARICFRLKEPPR